MRFNTVRACRWFVLELKSLSESRLYAAIPLPARPLPNLRDSYEEVTK